MPRFRCEVSNGISFNVYGEDFKQALEILDNLYFLPAEEMEDGLIAYPSYTLFKEPINEP